MRTKFLSKFWEEFGGVTVPLDSLGGFLFGGGTTTGTRVVGSVPSRRVGDSVVGLDRSGVVRFWMSVSGCCVIAFCGSEVSFCIVSSVGVDGIVVWCRRSGKGLMLSLWSCGATGGSEWTSSGVLGPGVGLR